MQETPDITNTNEAQEAAAAATGGDLEERLKKAEEAAQTHQDAYLRARAETDNVRKRSQTEIANAHKFAIESFTNELLAVKDSLEAGLGAENASVESMRAGVELTLRQLKAVFEKFNVSEVDPTGQKFDPHRHQAISTVEADAEPNTVVQTLQKGYLLHDRVIRPALVIVSKSEN
ncbi:MAG TPA: nucleotide exchange factor GrpE [Burkholderiales bacterium]|nr:nucleotide exchange factor GrpE [Burkholderiales bacterium]